jgi:hypothetical protein
MDFSKTLGICVTDILCLVLESPWNLKGILVSKYKKKMSYQVTNSKDHGQAA